MHATTWSKVWRRTCQLRYHHSKASSVIFKTLVAILILLNTPGTSSSALSKTMCVAVALWAERRSTLMEDKQSAVPSLSLMTYLIREASSGVFFKEPKEGQFLRSTYWDGRRLLSVYYDETTICLMSPNSTHRECAH